MTRSRHLLVLAGMMALLGLPRPAASQPAEAPPAPTTCAGTATTNARFNLAFNGTSWQVAPPTLTRITDRDRVEVCVEHFNFLRFTLKFDVKEQQSEAYAYLTKLWTSIVNPFAMTPPPPAAPSVVTLLHALYKETRLLDSAVETAAAPYKKTGLTATEAATLATARGGVSTQLSTARAAFNALDNAILNDADIFKAVHGEFKEMYAAVTGQFRTVEGRADIFMRLSEKTIGVEIKRIGKKNAGTKVTFTLAAIDESGAATPMEDVDYFVQSNMPLVAHGGISFSGLKDVTFSKVRRATSFGEEDLFQEQSSDNTTTGFALFLGWQFYGTGDVATNHREGRIGAAFSLGTDINAPGKRVYAGPSLMLFNRLVITGGAAFGKESSGEAVTLEPNLFRIVKEKPKAKFFFAVSTKVY